MLQGFGLTLIHSLCFTNESTEHGGNVVTIDLH